MRTSSSATGARCSRRWRWAGPAYVWDTRGGDGWVTPETYPALEADGFTGAATDPP